MSSWLELVEDKVEMAKREAVENAERTLQLMELAGPLSDDETVSLRRHLAAAIIFLGAKLDPDAIDALAAKQDAA